MSNINLAQIERVLSEAHENDVRQLQVIRSEKTRIIVEAPAGYGKTTTMVSRVAYILATEQINAPKRILGLTFSVNAALKAKRDIFSRLPILLGKSINPNELKESLLITNFHGVCKRILKKYGYLLCPILRNIDTLLAVGDERIAKTPQICGVLDSDETIVIDEIRQQIIDAEKISDEDISIYNDIIANKLLPKNVITHNAVILFTLELFTRFPEILRFYRNFFQFIIIDEFQDTNIIAWQLIQSLASETSKLLFMGDSLQRIYGFIGACPDIMNIAAQEFSMEKVTLEKNYRFRDNPEMLKLDDAIRRNAACLGDLSITTEAELPCCWVSTQEEEANWIAQKVTELLNTHPDSKIAILVRKRCSYTTIIEEAIKDHNISYFYALFSDDDPTYVDFHQTCLARFLRLFSEKKNPTNKSMLRVAQEISDSLGDSDPVIQSLIILLFATLERISVDYSELSAEDRRDFLIDIFENRQLKQAMEYVDAPVVLSTLHGAKGLEWDYVLLADIEQYVSTSFSLCKQCKEEGRCVREERRASCKITPPISPALQTLLINDLCLFYVGLTRARIQAYITASACRMNDNTGRCYTDGRIPCFVFLRGVKPYKCNVIQQEN